MQGYSQMSSRTTFRRLSVAASYQNAGVAAAAQGRRRPQQIHRQIAVSGTGGQTCASHYAEREARWRVQDERNRLELQQRDSEGLGRSSPNRGGPMGTTPAKGGSTERRGAAGGRRTVESRRLENAKRWLDWATEELRSVDPIGELLRHSWPIAPLGSVAPMPWSWD